MFSGIARIADALVGIIPVETPLSARRIAGAADALVHLGFALQPDVSGSTLTHKAFYLVEASAAVLARRALAVVDGVLTMRTGVSGIALTPEALNSVKAHSAVYAGRAGAAVYIDVAS